MPHKKEEKVHIDIKLDSDKNNYIIKVGTTQLELSRHNTVLLQNLLTKKLKETPILNLS